MIILDSGHHHIIDDTTKAYDPGCTWGNYKEADIVHNIKNKVAMMCYKMKLPYFIPCYHYDTRERFWQAWKHNPKYYLCLHANSAVSSSANGVEALYNQNGRQFANDLVYNLATHFGLNNRGCAHHTSNLRSPAMFDVAEDIPMVLLEVGFLSNAKDRNKLINYQDTFADIIFYTIAKLFKMDFTVFTIGSNKAEKVNEVINIPAPVIQTNGRTYFPVRTLEAIDQNNLVGWLPNQKKAVLYRK